MFSSVRPHIFFLGKNAHIKKAMLKSFPRAPEKMNYLIFRVQDPLRRGVNTGPYDLENLTHVFYIKKIKLKKKSIGKKCLL